MLPMLAQLGLALAATKMQKDEAKRAHALAQRQQLAQVQQDIAAKRASRAGDSGYMQQALGGMSNQPRMPDSPAGPMLAQFGAALLSQSPEPQAQQATAQKPIQWAGNGFDEDKYGNYA